MSHPDDGLLQEFLDGELPAADAAVVRAHIAGCAPCTAALADLRVVQSEADAIVSRLDLDPPLHPPVKAANDARRTGTPSLRLLGLAASAVLVAGTSWVLWRSPAVQPLGTRDESAPAPVQSVPAREQQEVPAVGARADADAGQGAKATDAPVQKDLAPPIAPRQAEKKEADDESRRANANPTTAPSPAARMAAPPAAPPRLLSGAAQGSGTVTTVADAETRLGVRLRTISGLTPVAVELLPPAADSLPAVRQRYVVSGVPVTLVQQVVPVTPRDEVSTKAHDSAPYVDGVAVQPGSRGNGFVTAESGGVQPVTRTWEAWGSLFQIRGALPADSIDALVRRVR